MWLAARVWLAARALTTGRAIWLEQRRGEPISHPICSESTGTLSDWYSSCSRAASTASIVGPITTTRGPAGLGSTSIRSTPAILGKCVIACHVRQVCDVRCTCHMRQASDVGRTGSLLHGRDVAALLADNKADELLAYRKLNTHPRLDLTALGFHFVCKLLPLLRKSHTRLDTHGRVSSTGYRLGACHFRVLPLARALARVCG